MKLYVERQDWKKKINQEKDKNIEIKIIWIKNGLRKQMH